MDIILNLAAFLQSTVGPLARRVLAALGLGYITYSGLSTTVNNFIAQAKDYFNGIPVMVLSILEMAGAGQALALITGDIVVRLVFGTGTKTIGILNP